MFVIPNVVRKSLLQVIFNDFIIFAEDIYVKLISTSFTCKTRLGRGPQAPTYTSRHSLPSPRSLVSSTSSRRDTAKDASGPVSTFSPEYRPSPRFRNATSPRGRAAKGAGGGVNASGR